MQKTFYQRELTISGPQQTGGADNKKDVMKIQSWLTLFDLANPGNGTVCNIDGGFGPATENAVKNYQRVKNLPQTGIADVNLFKLLSEPLQSAFETTPKGNGLRELIVNAAQQHLTFKPYELTINGASNSGPWVRSYLDGNEGEPWFWCMGFVQTIIDQAASAISKNFKTLMPLTYSCDVIGANGDHNGNLIRNDKIKKDNTLVKPGDIFLLQKAKMDWFHTGIVTAVGNGIFETIEGNTNDDGSHNGNRVCKRTRNYMSSIIDVFSVESLVN